jgi:hypothetical protein
LALAEMVTRQLLQQMVLIQYFIQLLQVAVVGVLAHQVQEVLVVQAVVVLVLVLLAVLVLRIRVLRAARVHLATV